MNDAEYRRRAHEHLVYLEAGGYLDQLGRNKALAEEFDALTNAGPEDLDDPKTWPIQRAHLVPSTKEGEIDPDEVRRVGYKPVIIESVTGSVVFQCAMGAIPCFAENAMWVASGITANNIGRVVVPIGKLCLRATHPQHPDQHHVWWFQGPCDLITPWSK